MGYGLLIVPGFFFSLTAVFAFDAPGSETSPLTLLFVFSLGIMPLTLLISCVGGLFCSFGRPSPDKIWMGRIFAIAPLLNLLLFIIAMVLLDTLCGGKFVCHL
jgi:hypothetical protein